MSDKYLTVKEWQKFAKDHKDKAYKDAPLLKALAAAEKAVNAPAAEQLTVLFELEDVGRTLAKQYKGDKKLESYLDDVYKALKKYRHDAEKAIDKQAKADEEEGNDTSTLLLQQKMIPLLRQVRKGEVMQALIGVAGSQAVVLVAKRAIPPTRRDLLKGFLEASSLKCIKGECRFEDNAHTFVVESEAAGLAKKLKAALLEQTGLRLKVRVRGAQGDVDEDLSGEADDVGASEGDATDGPPDANLEGDDGGAGDEAQEPAQTSPVSDSADALMAEFERVKKAAHPGLSAAVRENVPNKAQIVELMGKAQKAAGAEDWAAALAIYVQLNELVPPPDPSAAFNARLAALLPRLKEATAAGLPAVPQAKLKLSEAGTFGRQRAFAAGHVLLDEAEKLLQAPTARVDPAAAGAADTARTPAVSNVTFTQSRLAWDKTRKLVQAELRKLEAAILEACKDEPDFAAIAGNTQSVYSVLDVLDERLIDKLDEALNAEDPDLRSELQDEAREIVDEYLDYIKSDARLRAFDDNGFVKVAIVSSLTTCLTVVGKQLRAAATA